MEILGSGAGFFMGTLGKFSYVDIEPAEAYIDAINRGKFPVSKLSMASDEDEMGKMMMRLYIRLPVDKQEFKIRFGKLPEEAFETAINKLEKILKIPSSNARFGMLLAHVRGESSEIKGTPDERF